MSEEEIQVMIENALDAFRKEMHALMNDLERDIRTEIDNLREELQQ